MESSTYSRRFLVKGALASLALPLALRWMTAPAKSQVDTLYPLRIIASQKGRLFGSAVLQGNLFKDPQYADFFAKQCGILVPEGELKWGSLRPSPTAFNFEPADWLLAYAKQNQMQMRGHTLVWHQSLPAWFAGYVNAENAKEVLLSHIEAVVGHYKGQLQSWDVVNEVLSPGDKIPGGWRDTPWLKFLGPDHVEMAFRAARHSDPHVLLVWNENHVEDESYQHDQKRKMWLQQLYSLLSRDVPIGAIGIQSHLMGGAQEVGGPKFRQFLADVARMGLKILVTEMDVQDNSFGADPNQRDRQVADVYSRYLDAVLQQKATIAVLTWGLTDRYTWLKTYAPRSDGLDPRPLPFDSSLKPTLTYQAIRREFQQASSL